MLGIIKCEYIYFFKYLFWNLGMSGYKVLILNLGIKMVFGLFEFFLFECNIILGWCLGIIVCVLSVNIEVFWVESVIEIENFVSLEFE